MYGYTLYYWKYLFAVRGNVMRIIVSNGLPILCGLAILIWVFAKNRLKRGRCTCKMEGLCVEHRRKPGEQAYTPVYEIYWKGAKIRIWNHVYVQKIGKIKPDVGETCVLHINPDNPMDFYSGFDLSSDKVPIIVGVFFILLPIIFIFY